MCDANTIVALSKVTQKSSLCLCDISKSYGIFFFYYSLKHVNIKFVRCFCVIHKVVTPNLPRPKGPTVRLFNK